MAELKKLWVHLVSNGQPIAQTANSLLLQFFLTRILQISRSQHSVIFGSVSFSSFLLKEISLQHVILAIGINLLITAFLSVATKILRHPIDMYGI